MCKRFCNNCPHLVSVASVEAEDERYYYDSFSYYDDCFDVYCKNPKISQEHFTHGKNIQFYTLKNEKIEAPSWCPCGTDKDHPQGYVHKTPSEMRNFIKECDLSDELTSWDEIEVNQIYHRPPICGEPRKDFLITCKTANTLTCKEVSNSPDKKTYSVTTLYKFDGDYKFLRKNKLLSTVVVKKC